MRDPNRIDRILKLLGKVWKEVPDWRLGQLVSNLVGNDAYIFYVEDDKLEEKLKEIVDSKTDAQ